MCSSDLDWIVEGFEDHIKNLDLGTSLVVQWLGLGAFTAMAPGSIPGRGTKILQAARHGQKKKKKKKKKTRGFYPLGRKTVGSEATGLGN